MAPIDSLELEDEEDVDFDGIRLRWNRIQIPPYSAGEEPLLYMIEMNEPPLDEWRPIVSGLPTTRYRVPDLVPDRDYHFRVRALSSYGLSPPSYTLPVSYRRPLPGNLKKINLKYKIIITKVTIEYKFDCISMLTSNMYHTMVCRF
jgi:hypothetical protein